MNNKTIITQVIYFVLYIIFQVFFAKNLELFNVAFCFVYINFILNLPQDSKSEMVLFSGFLLGFIVDSFYNTWGIHSAACVFIAFIRPFVLKVVTPKNAGDDNDLKEKSLLRFSLYAIILIFIHHSIIFFIEIAHFKLFFRTLVKIFFSTIFTFVLSVIIQYLSPRKVTKQA